MMVKLYNKNLVNPTISWLDEIYIIKALRNGGVYKMIEDDKVFFTVTASNGIATLEQENPALTETCNYLTECWGYEYTNEYNHTTQFVWLDTFEQAANSRRIDQLQDVTVGPLVQGWK